MKKCRIGDLAMSIGSLPGKIVKILGEPERNYFPLPNGVIHDGADPAKDWVVESLSGPLPTVKGELVSMGVCSDRYLMPLRPDEAKEIEIARWEKVS